MNDPKTFSTSLVEEIKALREIKTANVRMVRKRYSQQINTMSPGEVLDLAMQVIQTGERFRWVAYELVHFHKPTLRSLGRDELELLGEGMNTWDKVDTFAPLLSGVAWREGQIGDSVVHDWARSKNLWWRRAALVSTIALNVKARGGKGDVARTLVVCEMLVSDYEDMVVKALSWALRCLVGHDPAAVRVFLDKHRSVLAARVKREVKNKLETGYKNP